MQFQALLCKVYCLIWITTAWNLGLASSAPTDRSLYRPLSQADGTWTNLTSLPFPRQEHSTVALDGFIYILGGVPPLPANGSLNIPTLTDAQRYSIKNKSWENIAPMPSPLNHANSVVHEGKIYVLGGLAPREDPLDWLVSNASFVYDPACQTWSLLPAIPAGLARGSAAMAAYGDEIILAGGMTELSLEGNYTQSSTSIVSAFNVRKQTWRSLPALPEGRDHDGYATIGNKFYLVGGRVNGQRNVRNTTFVLDLLNQGAGWKSLAPMPTARGGCTAGVVDGTVYVFGGEGNPEPGSNGVFPEVEAYNTFTDEWTKLPNMPVPRHGTVAAAADGGIYIPGGGIAISDAAVDIFDVLRP